MAEDDLVDLEGWLWLWLWLLLLLLLYRNSALWPPWLVLRGGSADRAGNVVPDNGVETNAVCAVVGDEKPLTVHR